MELSELSAAVVETVWREPVRAAVAQLHVEMEQEIARRKPLCVLSGRCCRFDEYGHRLYATTIELAAFLHDYLERPLQEIRQTVAAWDGKSCPFQTGKLCGVHAIRPLGCRLFYCDQTSTEWQSDQYEKFHARLKRLHESMAVPYIYVEWRTALSLLGFK